MNLLYIGYWGADDTLTVSTIIPHLKVLSSLDSVHQVVFCSIERGGPATQLSLPKIKHLPLRSKHKGNVLLTKLSDYFSLYRSLKKICGDFAIDLVICRSAMAGAFGNRLRKACNLPYIVESFEPHADYMVESQVWKWYDLRTIIEKYHEAQEKRFAAYLLPVSFNYAEELLREGVNAEKVCVLPCCVDVEKFRFKAEKRMTVRDRYQIAPSSVVGIYVGKFGGIYYDQQAFMLFKEAFDFFGAGFRLIILTNHDPHQIELQLRMQSISTTHVVIRSVPHHEVADYLSAADLAFCCIKPAPSRKHCSPVKNGEYWANGLPILLERGIGDDSAIIESEGGGAILEGDNLLAFKKIKRMLSEGRPTLANRIQQIGSRHRSATQITRVYEKVLSKVVR